MGRIEREPVDIGRMALDLADLLQSTSGQVRIQVDVDKGDPLTILGAEHRLGQVLRNLVDNAVSFSPKGGVVRIHVGYEKSQVVLSVQDEGPGVPDEARTNIFERFYTERPRSEAFGTHSGLGLNICRQIVEAHGGTIDVENVRQLGDQGLLVGIKGARFTVRLPVTKG